MKRIILTVAILAMASVAQAGDFYAKVGGGYSQANNDTSLFYDIGVGVDLTKNFAIEGGLVGFGDTQNNFKLNNTLTGQTNIINNDYSVSGQTVGVVGKAMVDEKVEARAIAGVLFYEKETVSDETTILGGNSSRVVTKTKINDNGFYGGFGLSYQTNPTTKTVIDYIIYDVDGAAITAVKVGIEYSF